MFLNNKKNQGFAVWAYCITQGGINSIYQMVDFVLGGSFCGGVVINPTNYLTCSGLLWY